MWAEDVPKDAVSLPRLQEDSLDMGRDALMLSSFLFSLNKSVGEGIPLERRSRNCSCSRDLSSVELVFMWI